MATFVRKATKKSLLSMLRKANKITPRLLAKLFEGVLFKDEYETFSAAGGIDHGGLGGLTDDDHPQYPLETDVDYALVSGNDAGTDITAAELEELSDESTTTLHSHSLGGSAGPICLDSYIDIKARQTEWNLHGALGVIDAGHDLGAGDLVTEVGIGKVVLAIIAANDFAGDITITGTSVDRNTGAETAADTDTITIDALTTDDSDTDASGNLRHSFTGAYISSKWFKGAITISSADTDVTDMDTYQVAFEQVNDNESVELQTADLTAYANNTAAWMYGYLYTLEVTGDKCDITRQGALELPASDVSAGLSYRIRKGNLGVEFDGTTDGFWADIFPGPLNQNYWEDVNIKFWFGVGSGETTITGYELSGTVTENPPLSGVTITLTGDSSDATTTDASGEYSFADLPNGSYTVTPTKTNYSFSPTSTAVTIANADQTGKDFTGTEDELVLPLTIDFESESVGTTPSWVTGWTGSAAPTVENAGTTVEGLTKCLSFAQGTGATLGAGSVELATGSGQAAGLGFDAQNGIKLQIIEHRDGSTERQTIWISDEDDELATPAPQNRVYFDDREEADPDTLRLLVEDDGSQTDSGDTNQTGINNATGNVWRYTRFEFIDDTSLTCKVYDTAGSQQGTTHSISWPGGGSTPSELLKYLGATAGAGFVYRIAEIWIGDGGDAWPSM